MPPCAVSGGYSWETRAIFTRTPSTCASGVDPAARAIPGVPGPLSAQGSPSEAAHLGATREVHRVPPAPTSHPLRAAGRAAGETFLVSREVRPEGLPR